MKITKTTHEVWSSNTDGNNREVTVTYDVDINPDELPELVNNFIRAGLGDIKPMLMDFLKSVKKV